MREPSLEFPGLCAPTGGRSGHREEPRDLREGGGIAARTPCCSSHPAVSLVFHLESNELNQEAWA